MSATLRIDRRPRRSLSLAERDDAERDDAERDDAEREDAEPEEVGRC